MVTACDITGKVICRTPELEGGKQKGGAGDGQGRAMPVPEGVRHTGPFLWPLSCHILF